MKQLKVLLVGVGTVGEAIARLGARAPWLDRMVLADYDVERARLIQARLGGGPADAPATSRFPVAFVDAGKPELVTQLAREHGVDIVVNAADPRFVPTIFDGAFAAGVDYLDMADKLMLSCRNAPRQRNSMLQDLAAGRRTEARAILGPLLLAAKRRRVPAPTLEILSAVIGRLERRLAQK